MRKVLLKAKGNAIIVVYDSPTKYEIVVAWNYDEINNCWGQGHYFTLWYDEITPENKITLRAEAEKYFAEQYL